MNIALPEVDGRVFSRAVSFKAADVFDEHVQATIVRHAPRADRVEFVADLAANWVRLRRKKAKERKVALVLANYPNRDGRIAKMTIEFRETRNIRLNRRSQKEGRHDAPRIRRHAQSVQPRTAGLQASPVHGDFSEFSPTVRIPG